MNRDARHVTPASADAWGRVAFGAGKAMARAGKPEEGNPHPLGSVEAENWRDGWRTVTAPRRS